MGGVVPVGSESGIIVLIDYDYCALKVLSGSAA